MCQVNQILFLDLPYSFCSQAHKTIFNFYILIFNLALCAIAPVPWFKRNAKFIIFGIRKIEIVFICIFQQPFIFLSIFKSRFFASQCAIFCNKIYGLSRGVAMPAVSWKRDKRNCFFIVKFKF